MKTARVWLSIALALIVGSVLILGVGCKLTKPAETNESARSETTPAPASTGPESGNAQLWVENCMRCHNLRPPRERSDREWEIITHHMRVRANLSGEEHRLILEFLKAGN